ncbi:MAG: hypothetical protein GXO10_02975 [Crenarchaeota archaeon]|nr:hypothetical protein [Thermoproteota archaeon]
MSIRLNMWKKFSDKVSDHIENYTVKQYGDYPDQLAKYSIEDILLQINRYLNRVTTNSRGEKESIRDCYKMAHYVSELWYRLVEKNKDKTTKPKSIICPKCGHIIEVEDNNGK